MVFSKTGTDEYGIDFDRMKKYRVERAKEMMNRYGLGALITWDEVNERYLAGFAGHNEGGYVIFLRNGDTYLPGPMGGREMPGIKSPPTPITHPRPCDGVAKEEFQNLAQGVADIMEEQSVRNEPLAIDGVASGILLQEAFKDVGVNAIYDNRVMAEARLIKNQDEIECLKIACANADEVFTVFKDKIRPGLTEGDLMAIGTNTLLVRVGQGSMMGGIFTIASGERTNPPQRLFTDRLVRPGDLVFIDPHNAYGGYEACCWRTFCCGKATAEQKEIYAEAREILYAGLSAVKAGNTALDVIEKWPSDPRRYGADNWEEIEFLVSGHGLGLGRGTQYPGIGRWVDYPRRFHPGLPKDILEKIIFEENMTLALETWNGKPGGKDGVYIEEDIVVTKDGYELLTKFPVDELTECWT